MDAAPVDIVDRGRMLTVQVDADLCDACPVEAGVRAYVCAHHGREYKPRLQQLGVVIDLSHMVLHTGGVA